MERREKKKREKTRMGDWLLPSIFYIFGGGENG